MRFRWLLTCLAIVAVVVPGQASSAVAPVIVVSSTENLADGAQVSIRVTEPLVDTSVSIRQCYGTDSTDQCWTYATGIQMVGSDPVSIPASRMNFWGQPLGPLVDCGVIQCFLHIEASQAFQPAYLIRDVALTFDSTPPAIRQPIAVAVPSVGLVGQQVVQVSGLGFTPNAEFRVRQCWVPFTYPWLERCTHGKIVESSSSGVVMTPLVVRRRLTRPESITTCGDGGTPCFVIVQRSDEPTERAMMMISFTGRTFERPKLVPLAVTVSEDVGIAMVRIRLDANPDRLVSAAAFDWHTLPWTANASDFQAANRSTLISPYLPVVYLPVKIIDDPIAETDEVALVQVTDTVNAGIGGYNGVGAVVIIDND